MRRATDRESTPLKTPSIELFRNYNRIIAVAYLGLLAGVAVFFGFQLRQSLQAELTLIEGQVERHGQFLEFVLRTSADQAEALRMALTLPCDPRQAERAPSQLVARSGGFHRDQLAERDAGSNLVGQGVLDGRDPRFYCELAAALALDAHFKAMAFHLPFAARTRLISARGFALQWPWQLSAAAPFDPRLYETDTWQSAQGAVNPDGLKFWAAPYDAGPAVGLLVPVAAPIEQAGHVLSVVAVDISLDYLNRVNSGFAYPLGRVAVVDEQGRVLADPRLYADPLKMRAPGRLAQVIATEDLASLDILQGLPQGQAVYQGSAVLVRRGFISAPWQMVYAVPRSDLWRKVLGEHGPSMAAVLLALGLLMALTYWITSREFVGPAAKLVRHLVAESSFEPQPMPRVPPVWRPWFQSITRAFRESVQLSGLRKEVDIAARMQQAILPRQWPVDPRFTLAGTMQAARDIGGDFYDHFPIDHGCTGIVVADVSGKGISAGLFGMVSKTLLRSVATQQDLGPGAVMRRVNDVLCADNEASMFVTTFCGQYEPDSGELRYVNAGHPPPLWIRADGERQWLERARAPALGVVEGVDYPEQTLRLAPGDLLLVYTDGVTDAIDAQGHEFGAQRLRALFDNRAPGSTREVIEGVLQAVSEFARGEEQFDDITCLALRRSLPGEAA